MNNRHIYRGKRIGIHAGDNGEWAFGCHSYDGAGKNTIDVINNLGQYEEMHVIDPDTLGQCTGLPDCNKKLIFEGDILKSQNQIIRVVWNCENAAFDLINKYCGSYRARAILKCEVIGNIHDNPELLREVEKKK